MRIYFEGYQYPEESIVPYLKDMEANHFVVPVLRGDKGRYVESIGYLFVASQIYSGPIFLLPKSFLQKDASGPDGKLTLLGMPGIVPEGIIDTEDEENILTAQGQETFLPELSIWLFRAMSRYVEDCKKENDHEHDHSRNGAGRRARRRRRLGHFGICRAHANLWDLR